MQFKQLGNMFDDGEIWSIFNGGGLKSANFKTASSISDMQNITQEMFNKQFRINSDGHFAMMNSVSNLPVFFTSHSSKLSQPKLVE